MVKENKAGVSGDDENNVEQKLISAHATSGATTLTPAQAKTFEELERLDESGILKTLSAAQHKEFVRQQEAIKQAYDAHEPNENVFTVKAVVISCDGDTNNPQTACYGAILDRKYPRYRQKGIGSEHQVFENYVSPLSERLGCPLHLLQFGFPPVPEKGNKKGYKANYQAAYLMQNVDRNSEQFGKLPYPIEPESTWTAMIARKDQKDLDPDFVRALCDFALVRVSKVVADYEAMKIDKQEVVDEITPAKFAEFVKEMRVREYHENYRGGSSHGWLEAYCKEELSVPDVVIPVDGGETLKDAHKVAGILKSLGLRVRVAGKEI